MTNENLPVQTRAEDGSLCYFPTLSEAMKFADQNKSVWKLSFSFEGERVRLVRRDDGFVVEQLDFEMVINRVVAAVNNLRTQPPTEEQLRICHLCQNWETGAGTVAAFCKHRFTTPTTTCFVGGPKRYI
jgi:hypothetical protein